MSGEDEFLPFSLVKMSKNVEFYDIIIKSGIMRDKYFKNFIDMYGDDYNKILKLEKEYNIGELKILAVSHCWNDRDKLFEYILMIIHYQSPDFGCY